MDRELLVRLRGDNRSLDSSLSSSERKMMSFGKRIRSEFDQIGKMAMGLGERLANPITGLVTGAGLTMVTKHAIDLNSQVARLAIASNRTGKEFFKIKDAMYDIGLATHQSPGALLEGIDAIVQRTGNFDFAVDSIKTLGIVASASNSSVAAIGATASNLQEKMDITSGQLLGVFDILAAQGKQGAFTLEMMSNEFERLLSAATLMSIKGEDGMRKFGAYMQLMKRGYGTAAETSTAIKTSLTEMISKAGQIKSVTGFEIFNKDKTTKDFELIVKEIITRTKGDKQKLKKIFGDTTITGINAVAESWLKHGDWREWDNLKKAGGNGAMIMKDFAFWSDQTQAKLDDTRVLLSKIADTHLAKPLEGLNKALDAINKNPVIVKGGLYALLGLGGLIAASKIRGLGAAGVAAGAGKGGGLGGFGGGPIPVYVVNKWMDMIPGAGGFGGAAGGAGGAAAGAAGSMLGKAANFLGKASLVAGVGYAAYDLTQSALGEERIQGIKDWGAESSFMETIFGGSFGAGLESALKAVGLAPSNPVHVNVQVDQNGKTTVETNSPTANVSAKRREVG